MRLESVSTLGDAISCRSDAPRLKSYFKDGKIVKADFLCYETGVEPVL